MLCTWKEFRKYKLFTCSYSIKKNAVEGRRWRTEVGTQPHLLRNQEQTLLWLQTGIELPENVSRAEPMEQGDAVWNYGMPGLEGTLKFIPWAEPPSQIAQGPSNNPAHQSWACYSQAFLALMPNMWQKIPSKWGKIPSFLWAKQEIPITHSCRKIWLMLPTVKAA